MLALKWVHRFGAEKGVLYSNQVEKVPAVTEVFLFDQDSGIQDKLAWHLVKSLIRFWTYPSR